MHDGQNLFDAATSFAGEWQVDETMERIAPEGFEAIVVAVPNMGAERIAEYSPFRDDARWAADRGDAYLRVPDRHAEAARRQPLPHPARRRAHGHRRVIDGRADQPLRASCAARCVRLCRRDEPLALVRRAARSSDVADAATHWPGRLYLDTGTAEGRRQVRQTREMVRMLRTQGAGIRDDRFTTSRTAAPGTTRWRGRRASSARFGGCCPGAAWTSTGRAAGSSRLQLRDEGRS